MNDTTSYKREQLFATTIRETSHADETSEHRSTGNETHEWCDECLVSRPSTIDINVTTSRKREQLFAITIRETSNADETFEHCSKGNETHEGAMSAVRNQAHSKTTTSSLQQQCPRDIRTQFDRHRYNCFIDGHVSVHVEICKQYNKKNRDHVLY